MPFSLDPFSDASRDSAGKRGQEGFIHIRIQQRNGRKTLTTVQGIAEEYDKKKIVKACKKVQVYMSCLWACPGMSTLFATGVCL